MTEAQRDAKVTAPNPVAFSIDTMAARTGLSRSFLYEELKLGKLQSFKVGKRRLVAAEDETAYLAAYRQRGRAGGCA
jgi:excisionase family DNA binding protein